MTTKGIHGKGTLVLLVIFIAVGIIMSIPAIIYQMANPSLGYIANERAQQVTFSDGKIFLRTSGATNGYQVYDNVTLAEIGARTKFDGWEFRTICAKGDFVYGVTDHLTLVVDYWGGSGSTPETTSIEFTNQPECVAVQGDYAYVGLTNRSIAIVNTSLAPASVSLVNVTADVEFQFKQIVVSGNYVYAAAGSGDSSKSVMVVNVTDFTSLGTPQAIFGATDFFSIYGDFGYAVKYSRLSIYDMSSPMAPVLVKDHFTESIITNVNDLLVCQVGTQRLALILTGSKVFVVDVTDPSAPATLGIIGSTANLGMTSFTDDESRLYASTPTVGIWLLAKDKLAGLYLTPPNNGINFFLLLTMVFHSITILIPVITTVFFWKRERQIAESKRVEFWVKPSTVTRTGIILALAVIPIFYLLFSTLGLIPTWYMGLIAAFIGLILFTLPRISLRRQRKRKQKLSTGTDTQTRLLGIIKAEKKINMKSTSEMTGLSEDKIKTLIYDLVGEGRIEGEMKGDEFLITSDVNAFIKDLERSFSEWEEQAKTGEAKKV